MYYLTNGGILMYVILIMSIIGLSAVIERFIHFRKYEKDNRTTLNKELRVMIEQGNIIDVVKKLHPEKSAVSNAGSSIIYWKIVGTPNRNVRCSCFMIWNTSFLSNFLVMTILAPTYNNGIRRLFQAAAWNKGRHT